MKRTTARNNENNRFTNGDPTGTGTDATFLEAEDCNMWQEEICNAIIGLGFSLDGSKENQLLVAIQSVVGNAIQQLGNIQDVDTAGLALNHSLIWNGTKWTLIDFVEKIADDISTASSTLNSAINSLESNLLGGVPVESNNLNKLHNKIETILTVLNSDTLTLDTLQEIVTFVQANKTALDNIGANKVDKTSIYNGIDSTDPEKVLAAPVGKALADRIEALENETRAPVDAEKNVQSDWTQTNTSADDYIKNKPLLAPANAEQNVQPDWNVTSGDAFIKNKPSLNNYIGIPARYFNVTSDINISGAKKTITSVSQYGTGGVTTEIGYSAGTFSFTKANAIYRVDVVVHLKPSTFGSASRGHIGNDISGSGGNTMPFESASGQRTKTSTSFHISTGSDPSGVSLIIESWSSCINAITEGGQIVFTRLTA